MQCRQCQADNEAGVRICTTCGALMRYNYAPSTPKKASTSSSPASDVVSFGVLLVVVAIFAFALWPRNGTVNSSSKVAATTPKPDRHAERERIQTYWNHVINSLAMANEATVAAAASVQGGDLVSASRFLKQGQEAATHAKEMSQSEVPNGYSEVGSTLFTASDTFADSIRKESDFLDTRAPSVAAEALEQRQRAQGEIEDAQHAARLKYVDLGGKIDDLSSFADAANAADQLLKMFSH